MLDPTFLPRGAVAPPVESNAVQLGAFEPRSHVAGPGERAVVWVTGCLRRCPGCMKPEWFGFDTGTRTPVDEVVARVLAEHARRPLAGLTFSGGEPFEQSVPLAKVAAAVRSVGLDVLVYSGYRLAALRADPRFAGLLAECDWLIDGEYDRRRPGPLRWRGSDNQAVHRRTAEGLAATEFGVTKVEVVREVQVSLTAAGLRLTGFPDTALTRQLRARLSDRGITMTESHHGE